MRNIASGNNHLAAIIIKQGSGETLACKDWLERLLALGWYQAQS